MLPVPSAKLTAAAFLPWFKWASVIRPFHPPIDVGPTALLHLIGVWIVFGHAEDEQILRDTHGAVVRADALSCL